MSYLALYRKYRPTTFDEVVGQDYVKKVLKNSIKNEKISHAYLFSGPRGTGKTTLAKLISKLINCSNPTELDACNECESCLAYLAKNHPDIIEIDAASNNGVDEIREIREKVNLMPSLSKYKIYIIDEVHMLSIGAFNALLKTLEEPPKHVIFILATTEFYKVPETIVSRCQCFDFEKISISNIEQKLNEIIDKENFKIDDNVVSLIAKYSNGGLRDAINMLDKLVSSTDNVTLADFYEIRGLITNEKINLILEYLNTGKIDLLFNEIEELDNKGKSMVLLVEELMNYLKDDMIECIKNNKQFNYDKKFIFDTIDILNNTLTLMKNSSNPKIILEVNLLKIIEQNKLIESYEYQDKNAIIQTNVSVKKESTIEQKQEIKEEKTDPLVKPLNLIKEQTIKIEDGKIKFNDTEKIEQKISKLTVLLEENRKIRINNTFATANKELLNDLKIRWVELSNYLADESYKNIVSYLIDGDLKVAGDDYVIISVTYSAILENALVNIEKLEELFEKAMNHHYKLAFILDTEWDSLKKEYIENKKNGIDYQLKEEKSIKYDIINDSEQKLDDQSEVVKEAFELFGDDIVEIK